MFVIRCIIFHLIILNIVKLSQELVELPEVEENDILITEAILRNTTNNLFSTIKFKRVKDNTNTKLRNYTLIHNYLVSLTLQDYNSLKEIARLTRTDNKNIDNRTENVMVLLNEILNEDRHSAEHIELKIDDVGEDLTHYVQDHMRTIQYLKNHYGANSPKDIDLNQEVLTILERKALEQKNILHQRAALNKTNKNYNEEESNSSATNADESLLGKNDFWVPELSGRRIYRGKRTRIAKFPFMASVQIFNQFQCGSAIIMSDLVLTAASCLQLAWNNRFYRENPAFLSVRIGSDFYTGGGENIGVLEVYFHPSYNPKNLRNNLAVMRLVRKINFPRHKRGHVKMIDIDRQDNPLPMNTDGITIVGWGARTRGNTLQTPYENKLAYAILDVYPLEDCQDIYSKEYVTHKNFCAGFLSKGSGACNRDVGGPGIVSGYLTGVVSFGSPVCGTPDAPTVFTKVGYYTDWLEEIMEQDTLVPQGKKRTTVKTSSLFPFSLHQHHTRQTTWRVEPLIPGTTEMSEYVNNKDNGLRQQENVDLFRDFLKTMFDSNEIEQYIDFDTNDKASIARTAEIIGQRDQQRQQILQQQELLQQQQIILQQQQLLQMQHQSVKTTDSTVPNRLATQIVDMEPRNSEESSEKLVKESAHKTQFTALYKRDNLSKNHKKDHNSERKDIEIDLIKLIDDKEINNFFKESLQEPSKTDQDSNNTTNGEIDNNLLTLLYVSDNDKSGLKFFDKFNDGEDLDPNMSEGVGIPLAGDRENEDDGMSIGSDEFKDFTYRNRLNRMNNNASNNNDDGFVDRSAIVSRARGGADVDNGAPGNYNEIFSKQVLFDILSEVIEDENQNKTLNA